MASVFSALNRLLTWQPERPLLTRLGLGSRRLPRTLGMSVSSNSAWTRLIERLSAQKGRPLTAGWSGNAHVLFGTFWAAVFVYAIGWCMLAPDEGGPQSTVVAEAESGSAGDAGASIAESISDLPGSDEAASIEAMITEPGPDQTAAEDKDPTLAEVGTEAAALFGDGVTVDANKSQAVAMPAPEPLPSSAAVKTERPAPVVASPAEPPQPAATKPKEARTELASAKTATPAAGESKSEKSPELTADTPVQERSGSAGQPVMAEKDSAATSAPQPVVETDGQSQDDWAAPPPTISWSEEAADNARRIVAESVPDEKVVADADEASPAGSQSAARADTVTQSQDADPSAEATAAAEDIDSSADAPIPAAPDRPIAAEASSEEMVDMSAEVSVAEAPVIDEAVLASEALLASVTQLYLQGEGSQALNVLSDSIEHGKLHEDHVGVASNMQRNLRQLKVLYRDAQQAAREGNVAAVKLGARLFGLAESQAFPGQESVYRQRIEEALARLSAAP